MRLGPLALLLAAAVAVVVATAMTAPPPAPPEAEPPPLGGPRSIGLNPFWRSLDLDPGVPKVVLLQSEMLNFTMGAPPPGALRAEVDALQVNGGSFGLLAKPTDGGLGGFSGQGVRVQGVLTGTEATREFLFFTKTEGLVDAGVARAVWGSERVLETVARSSSVDLTGLGRNATLDLEVRDVLVEVSRGGAGVVVLRDPGGVERLRLGPAAVEAWAFVESPGSWVLACEGACAGSVGVRVTAARE